MPFLVLENQGIKLVNNARILVVDDDELIRDTLAIALEQNGYIVETAINGKEAIAKSNAKFLNLAIVDWRLPDIDGTKLLGKLKDTTPKMAKIMLTGYPSMQNAIEAVNEHADAFILKPIRMESFLEEVKKQLALQETEINYNQKKAAEFIETQTRLAMESMTRK